MVKSKVKYFGKHFECLKVFRRQTRHLNLDFKMIEYLFQLFSAMQQIQLFSLDLNHFVREMRSEVKSAFFTLVMAWGGMDRGGGGSRLRSVCVCAASAVGAVAVWGLLDLVVVLVGVVWNCGLEEAQNRVSPGWKRFGGI